MTNIIMSGVQLVIGAAVGYYGYSGAMTPAVPSFMPPPVANTMNTMMGGLRRAMRR